MKLEIKHRDRSARVEVQRGDASDLFQLEVERSDGAVEKLNVRLLSRTGDRWTLDFDGRVEDLLLSVSANGHATVEWRHRTIPLQIRDLREKLLQSATAPEIAGSATLRAQMPGKVIEVIKRAGDLVEVGEGLVIIESMKMQNELRSPATGVVVFCGVEEGGSVNAGAVLYRIEPPQAD